MRRKSRRAWAEAAARRADEELLARRLKELGLPAEPGLEMHENRSVLVSVTQRGVLRIHRGYAYASDRVLRAVVTYVSSDAELAAHRQAERVLESFPVDAFVSPLSRPARPRGGDRRLVARLRGLHEELNRRHFGGALAPIAFRVSSRMRTCLGEITLDARSGLPVEIAVSRHHIVHDGWDEVTHTVLHEMVHQWQAETGREADHGPAFRRKAREVGIAAVASRDLDVRSRYTTGDQEEEGAA